MSRFYFDITDDDGRTIDETGSELPDLDRAQRQAMRSIGEIIQDWRLGESNRGSLSMTIRDETSLLLFIRIQIEQSDSAAEI
jgi:hypothetical protein